jgi:PST family polysaccharide transporter
VHRIFPTLRPTVWVTIENGFGQAFAALIFAIQAPLLGPYVFGSITLAMVCISVWDAVPRLAATDALISIRNIEPQHWSTTTTVGILMSLIFGATVFALAGPLALALGDGELAPVVRALAVLPLIQSLAIAPIAAAQRSLQMQATTIRTVAGLAAGGIVGLILALLGAGVWALVCQALVQAAVATIVLWSAVPIPFRLEVSYSHLRDVARFAVPAMVGRAMNWAGGQLPRFMLGVSLGPTVVGLFGLGARLNDIIVQVAIIPKTLVARVDLRRFEAGSDALVQAVRRTLFKLSLLAFPICLGGAAVVPVLFSAWLGARWQGAVVSSQLMLLMGVPAVTYYAASAVLLALNRQKSEAAMSTLNTVSILVTVLIFVPFGLVAVTGALAARLVLMLPVPITMMRRQGGVRPRDILMPQAIPFIAAVGMGAAVRLLSAKLGSDSVSSLVELLGFGVFAYAALLTLFLPKRVFGICKQIVDAIERRYIASLALRTALRPLRLEWLLYYRRHRRAVRTTRPYRRDAEPGVLLEKLQGMNLVFAVTAGRSGTTLARQLFALLPGVTSEHEPEPSFHVFLRRIERDPDIARQFLLRYKLPVIADLPTSNYVELNHTFSEGFLEPLLALGVRPNLLLLRREPRLIALSYLERFTVPERTFLGLEWLISPRFARSLPVPNWRRMSDYQLLFWYALEIERRQREYAGLITSLGGVARAATTAEMTDFASFAELSEALGLLSATADHDLLARHHAEISQTQWNINEGPRWRYVGDIEREEEEVWRAVSRSAPELRQSVEGWYRACWSEQTGRDLTGGRNTETARE